MTEAMLEVLPRAPRIDSISELISKVAGQGLPPVTDPGWALAARRALVERLIEQLASGGAGVSANMDRLARELAHSYEPGEQQPSSGEEPQPITTAGPEALWRSLHAEAERAHPPISNPHSRSSRSTTAAPGRRALAAGPVQAWAAEQVSVAELLAYVTVGERSTRARTVAQIMDDMSIRRRESKHIFEQLHASERAMLPSLAASPWAGGRMDRFMTTLIALGISASMMVGAAPPAASPEQPASAETKLPTVPIPDLADRLTKLDPADPLPYFLLAEEVLVESLGNPNEPNQAGLSLARRLLVLAYSLDQRLPRPKQAPSRPQRLPGARLQCDERNAASLALGTRPIHGSRDLQNEPRPGRPHRRRRP